MGPSVDCAARLGEARQAGGSWRYGRMAIYPAGYWAVQPPSTISVVPVINAAAGDARKTTAPTTSRTSPNRPIGIRANGHHPYARGRQLDRRRLGEALHEVLRCRVHAVVRSAVLAERRRQVDDHATRFPSTHRPSRSLSHEHHGPAVEVEHRVQRFRIDVEQRRPDGGARVVDTNINRTELGEGLSHRIGVGHVAHHSPGRATLRCDGFNDGVQLGCGAAHGHHLGSRLGQGERTPSADPTACAGHYGHLALHTHRGQHVFCIWLRWIHVQVLTGDEPA